MDEAAPIDWLGNRKPSVVEGHAAAGEPLPAPPVTKEQIDAIVDRLEDIIAEYTAQAFRLDITIAATALVTVIDRAIEAAGGNEPAVVLHGSPEEFFLEDLYLELTQQPTSIFDEVRYADGSVYWTPMSGEVWSRCLLELRARFEHDPQGSEQEK